MIVMKFLSYTYSYCMFGYDRKLFQMQYFVITIKIMVKKSHDINIECTYATH